MEDFDLQMEREKARLNRFIGVKELNNKTEVEKNEQLRKSIMEKEKKQKKDFDKFQKEERLRNVDRFDKLRETRQKELEIKKLTIQDMG